jgi:hypothetical protein
MEPSLLKVKSLHIFVYWAMADQEIQVEDGLWANLQR